MNKDTRVLVVDDDEALQSIVKEVLVEEGYPVTTAGTGERALKLFKENPFHIVIVDIRLPGINGLDVLERIKELDPETEIIVITSYASLESSVFAMRAGAYDYLPKPFDDVSLISAVVGRAAEKVRLSKENRRLIEDLKQSRDDLERVNRILMDLAIRDGLTGLYNHRYFQEFLEMEIARSPRHGHPFSLIFMDVDHFKHYNDTHGHVDGDNVLRQVSEILRQRFRRMDLIARYGGEEFVILLPETPPEAAMDLAEETRGHIEEFVFEGEQTQPLGRLTASFGVASFPTDGKDADTLLRKADNALYRAKATGRNRVCKG